MFKVSFHFLAIVLSLAVANTVTAAEIVQRVNYGTTFDDPNGLFAIELNPTEPLYLSAASPMLRSTLNAYNAAIIDPEQRWNFSFGQPIPGYFFVDKYSALKGNRGNDGGARFEVDFRRAGYSLPSNSIWQWIQVIDTNSPFEGAPQPYYLDSSPIGSAGRGLTPFYPQSITNNDETKALFSDFPTRLASVAPVQWQAELYLAEVELNNDGTSTKNVIIHDGLSWGWEMVLPRTVTVNLPSVIPDMGSFGTDNFFTVYYAAPPTEKATLKSLTIDLGSLGFFDTADAPPGSSSSPFSVNSSSLQGILASDIRADVTDGSPQLKVNLNSGTFGNGDSFAFGIDTDPSGTAPDRNFTTKEDFNGVKVRFEFDDGYSLWGTFKDGVASSAKPDFNLRTTTQNGQNRLGNPNTGSDEDSNNFQIGSLNVSSSDSISSQNTAGVPEPNSVFGTILALAIGGRLSWSRKQKQSKNKVVKDS